MPGPKPAPLTDTERWAILTQSGLSRAAKELSSKPAQKSAAIVGEVGVGYMVDVVAQLGSDAAADLIRNLPADFGNQVLDQLTPVKSADVREVLSYPLGTVGSMMTKECLFVPDGMNVAEAIEYLHLLPQERKGRSPYVYVVDAERRLVGVFDTQDLILNSLDRPVADIMKRRVVAIPISAPKSEVAKLMQNHRFLGLPVVDESRRLAGTFSADNAIQAVKDKADSDIAHMVGTGADELRSSSVPKIMGMRLPWLFISVCSGLLCAVIGEVFQHDGTTLATLFIFIPVMLGISESTGIQGATIVVRSTAEGKLQMKDLRMLLTKEIAVGVLIGIVCGVIVGLITSFWQGNPLLGVAVAVSMTVTVFISAITGLVLPFVFKALRIDPALASGPLVLAICDLQTLFVYFNLANYILTR